MKQMICLILAIVMVTVMLGCTAGKADAEEKVIYEAIFLDNDEVVNLFSEVRGAEAPHGILTKDFHVTTAFMPEQDMREFYGTEVTVRIYAYQDGEVVADDGSVTENEGFFCTIETENAQLQNYLDHLDNNWHITGSYKDQGGAKYTGALDLTDAQQVSYTIVGRFGGYMSDNNVYFA